MSASNEPLSIAIVGGGVAGLSAAYYLQQQAKPGQRPLQIEVFERKATLGGNADTVVVDLGDYIDGDGQLQAYIRWADLGVNDVNLATYKLLRQVMEEIGYLQNMKPLQDTTCYFSSDGSLALTDDSALRLGVSDPTFSLAYADGGLLSSLIQVVHRAALNLLNSISPEYTVGYFFQQCFEQPQQMLADAADQLNISIDWSDSKLPQRVAQVRDDIYYPRISAMYFTDERGPQVMPLRAPFEYYRLQEGGVTPDRRYFDHGAQTWLEALAAYLLAHSNDQVAVQIHTNAPVAVKVQPGNVELTRASQPSQRFDLCILATHADDTRELLSFSDSMAGWGRQLGAVLDSVSYTFGYAVCHTYDALLPRNRNIWRTYNVLQRGRGDSVFPYRMSYVETLHQNDPANPRYNQAGLPQFFVSLVEDLNQIPLDAMLDRVVRPERVHPKLLAALPYATRLQLQGEPIHGGYRPTQQHEVESRLAGKAWTVFKHNVLNAGCFGAQNAIQAYNAATASKLAQGQIPQCALLFGGGWTKGAGLQEQCLEQSQQLAMWIDAANQPTGSVVGADANVACPSSARPLGRR